MPDQRYSFDARFGPVIRSQGIAAIPSTLFELQSALGISPQECWLLCVLLSYRWDARNLYPSIRTMAAQSGVTRQSIQGYLASLKAKGLVAVIEQVDEKGRQTSSQYNLDGLFARLEHLILARAGPSRLAVARPKFADEGQPVVKDGQAGLPEVEPGEGDSEEGEMSRDELRARRLGHRIADRFGTPSKRDAMAQMVESYARDRDPATVERAVALTLAAWGSEDGDEAEFWRRVGRKLT